MKSVEMEILPPLNHDGDVSEAHKSSISIEKCFASHKESNYFDPSTKMDITMSSSKEGGDEKSTQETDPGTVSQPPNILPQVLPTSGYIPNANNNIPPSEELTTGFRAPPTILSKVADDQGSHDSFDGKSSESSDPPVCHEECAHLRRSNSDHHDHLPPTSYCLKDPMAAYYLLLQTRLSWRRQLDPKFSTRRDLAENRWEIPKREDILDAVASAALYLPCYQSISPPQLIATSIAVCEDRVILYFASSGKVDHGKVTTFYQQLWYHLHRAYEREQPRGDDDYYDRDSYLLDESDNEEGMLLSRIPIAKCLLRHGWSRLYSTMRIGYPFFKRFLLRLQKLDRIWSEEIKNGTASAGIKNKDRIRARESLRRNMGKVSKYLDELNEALGIRLKSIPESSPSFSDEQTRSSILDDSTTQVPSQTQLNKAFEALFFLFEKPPVRNLLEDWRLNVIQECRQEMILRFSNGDPEKKPFLKTASDSPSTHPAEGSQCPVQDRIKEDQKDEILIMTLEDKIFHIFPFLWQLRLFINNFRAIRPLLLRDFKNPWYAREFHLLDGTKKFQVKPINLDVPPPQRSLSSSYHGLGCYQSTQQKSFALDTAPPRFPDDYEWWKACLRGTKKCECFPRSLKKTVEFSMDFGTARGQSQRQAAALPSALRNESDIKTLASETVSSTSGNEVQNVEPADIHPELQLILHRNVNSLLLFAPRIKPNIGTSHKVCSPCKEILEITRKKISPLLWSGRSEYIEDCYPEEWSWPKLVPVITREPTQTSLRPETANSYPATAFGDNSNTNPPLPHSPTSSSVSSSPSNSIIFDSTSSQLSASSMATDDFSHESDETKNQAQSDCSGEYCTALKAVLEWYSGELYSSLGRMIRYRGCGIKCFEKDIGKILIKREEK